MQFVVIYFDSELPEFLGGIVAVVKIKAVACDLIKVHGKIQIS